MARTKATARRSRGARARTSVFFIIIEQKSSDADSLCREKSRKVDSAYNGSQEPLQLEKREYENRELDELDSGMEWLNLDVPPESKPDDRHRHDPK